MEWFRLIPIIMVVIFGIVVFSLVSQGTYYSSEKISNEFKELGFETRYDSYNSMGIIPLRFCEVRMNGIWTECTKGLHNQVLVERELRDK